jgi:hypothetical protein
MSVMVYVMTNRTILNVNLMKWTVVYVLATCECHLWKDQEASKDDCSAKGHRIWLEIRGF